MTRYILRHIFHLTMFALLVGGLLVGSSRTDSQPNKSIVLQADAQLAKCGTVDASVTQGFAPLRRYEGARRDCLRKSTQTKGRLHVR